jgi:hypothetical protein
MYKRDGFIWQEWPLFFRGRHRVLYEVTGSLAGLPLTCAECLTGTDADIDADRPLKEAHHARTTSPHLHP